MLLSTQKVLPWEDISLTIINLTPKIMPPYQIKIKIKYEKKKIVPFEILIIYS